MNEQFVEPSDLIIIVTTSPIPSNPSTEIIDQAISTIRQQLSLSKLLIYIICDGYNISKTEQITENRFKSGVVTRQSGQKYQIYKQNLHKKYGNDKQIVIQQRQKRYCFAQNIDYVMRKVKQQYVMIFQHDHLFLRQLNFSRCLNVMKKHHEINYIGFMNNSVVKIPHYLDQYMEVRKYFCQKIDYHGVQGNKHTHKDFKEKVLDFYTQKYGYPLMPLTFWYDKVHIARKSFYLEVIFNPIGFYDEINNRKRKTLSFVEDSYGTYMQRLIRIKPEKVQKLGAYIWWDNSEHVFKHSMGRYFLTKQMKDEKYQQKYFQRERHEAIWDADQDEKEQNGTAFLNFMQSNK